MINVVNQPKTPTVSIMDLGKQLLESAREGQTARVHDLMCRGAPFTTDWVDIANIHFVFRAKIMIIELNFSWGNQRCTWLLRIITIKLVKRYFGQVSARIHEQKLKGRY